MAERRRQRKLSASTWGRVDVLGSLYQAWQILFGGKRDMRAVLGYRETLTYDDYLSRWARGDIAGRIVDIPAEATWGVLPRLTDDPQHLENALSEKFARLAHRIHLRQKIEKADKLAGIGRYATLLIGFRDGLPLDRPVPENELGSDDVLFVQPFGENNATPGDYDLNPKSPGFGRPEFWHIDFSRGLTDTDPSLASLLDKMRGAFTAGKPHAKVHVSRLVHVAEGTLEDEIFGMPRLRRVWDRLDDLAKTVGASAEVFWQTANRGMQLNVDKDLQLLEEDEEDLRQQVTDYEHGLSRVFTTRGVTMKGLNELGAGNVNPRAVFAAIAALIVGTTGIPFRMLFGTERGQNISSQDRRAWLEQVSWRQENFANEVVLRPFIERMVHAGCLPKLALDAALWWPPIHDDMHAAEILDTVARGCLNIAKAQQMGFSPITTGEARSIYLGLPPELPTDTTDTKRQREVEKKEAADREAETARAEAAREAMNGDARGEMNGAAG